MLIAAFVSLYLNVRKPREILQDWGTLGSSVAWASGPGYPVPAGREGRLRPVPRGTTPDRSAPAAAWGLRSTFRPIRPKRLGGRPAGPTRCGGAEGEPESPCPTLSTPFPPSRVSGWPGRVFEEEFGLRDPRRRAVIYSPQPSQQTSKRGGGDPPPDAWRRDPTVSTQRQAGKPPGGSYISHPTYDRRAGVSRSSPRVESCLSSKIWFAAIVRRGSFLACCSGLRSIASVPHFRLVLRACPSACHFYS